MKLEVPEILWNVPLTRSDPVGGYDFGFDVVLQVSWNHRHVALWLVRKHTGRETYRRSVFLQEDMDRLLEIFRPLVIAELCALRWRKQGLLVNALPEVLCRIEPELAPDFKRIEDTLYYLYDEPVPTLWDRLEADALSG